MTTALPSADVRRQLQKAEEQIGIVEKQIGNLQKLRSILEGRRDTLVSRLTDVEGAHDRRHVAVR